MPTLAATPCLVTLAGLGGAKVALLIMVLALPLILIVGTYLRRSRSR